MSALNLNLGSGENTGDAEPLRQSLQKVQAAVNSKADTASPALEGAPTAPTPAVGEANGDRIATVGMVRAFAIGKNSPLHLTYQLGGRQDYESPHRCIEELADRVDGVEKGMLELGPGEIAYSDAPIKLVPHVYLKGAADFHSILRYNGSRNAAITNPADPAFNNADVLLCGGSEIGHLRFWTHGEHWHDTIVWTGEGIRISDIEALFPGVLIEGIQQPAPGYGRARVLRGLNARSVLLNNVNTNRAAVGINGTEAIRLENTLAYVGETGAHERFNADHVFRNCFFDDTKQDGANATTIRTINMQNLEVHNTRIWSGFGANSFCLITERSGPTAPRTYVEFQGIGWGGNRRVRVGAGTTLKMPDDNKPGLVIEDGGEVLFYRGTNPSRVLSPENFAWRRQGPATAQMTPDGEMILTRSYTTGTALSALVRTAPQADFSVVAAVDLSMNYAVNWLSGGVVARNPTSDTYLLFGIMMTPSGPTLVVKRFVPSNGNLVFDVDLAGPVPLAMPAGRLILDYTGGVFTCRLDANRVLFDTFYTSATMAGFTEAGIAVVADNQNAPQRPVRMAVSDIGGSFAP